MPKLKHKLHSNSKMRITLKRLKHITKLNNMQKLLRLLLDRMPSQVMPMKVLRNNVNQRRSLRNANLAKKRVLNVFTNPNLSKKNLAQLTTLPLKLKPSSKK